ncbi:5'/3'-nucleotidase SurE [Gemmatimonadota bacterium]
MTDPSDQLYILLTNDDGVHAPGLRVLEKALAARWDTVVVAPDREQSASSHSLTLHHPLRVQQLDEKRFSVDGTPTDCVMLGMHGLLPRQPNLIVSGINHGSNLGDDVIYSGTVAAAVEGCLLGGASIAISLVPADDNGFDLRQAEEVACAVVAETIRNGLKKDYLLNVNIPPGPPGSAKGYRVSRLGRRSFREGIFKDTDPRGKPYYWIGGQDPAWVGGDDADFKAIEDGYVSLTPLRLDWTDESGMGLLQGWELIDINGCGPVEKAEA